MAPNKKNTYMDANKVLKEIETNKKNWTKVIEIIEDNEDTQNKINYENDKISVNELEESKKFEYCDCDEILFETLNKFTKNYSKNKKNKSIVNFDYNEIHMMDMEELSDYDINTLLKVLIVRGSKNNNPILWSKTKTLLKILNFELKPNYYYNNRNKNSFRRDDKKNRKK
jgi:hypothetical protein